MKKCVLFLLTLTVLNVTDNLRAQGTAFTYQGQLIAGGGAAGGNYDFTFALYNNSATNSGQVGATLTNLNVGVTNGLFTVTLDFGANFPGANRWLAIGVRTNGGSSFTALSPLQALAPTPYAIYAPNSGAAASAGSVAASNISGTLPLAQLPATVLTNAEAGVTLTGSFTGNGGGLTNIADWHLAGNTGTTTNNFLGTTDNQPLQIRVGGAQAGLITPTNGSPNIVFGAAQNVISNGTVASSILGGSNNIIFAAANFSTIGGGNQNVIQVSANNSVVAGGSFNTISNYSSFSSVGGGYANSIYNSSDSLIGGGYLNSIQTSSHYSVLVGGYANILGPFASYSFMGGGGDNLVQSSCTYAFLGGGAQNQILANAYNSAIVGGQGNVIAASASSSFIGGGYENTASGSASFSVIGGGNGNTISTGATMSFIGGGNLDNIQSSFSVLGGGSQNTISTSNTMSFIGGGNQNNIQTGASNSVLVGGWQNTISSNAAYSSLGGGQSNIVGGKFATVPGGATNLAGGQFSFAAGANAQAVHGGAFVWSDAEGTTFASTNTNSFNVRANGGARFVTGGAGLTVDGSPVQAGNNGGSLTNLNASNLTSGSVPLAQLPVAVVTNNEPNVSLGSLTLTSNLDLPRPAIISSSGTPFLRVDTNQDSYFGSSAGTAATGTFNTGIGFNALFFSSGSFNSAIGHEALFVSTGSYNAANGYLALANTSGSYNTGNGSGALSSSTGSYNTGNGYDTMIYYRGSYNTGNGYEALGGANILYPPTGGSNTADGAYALYVNLSGSQNAAVGIAALSGNISGNQNVAVGANALANSTNDNELVAIGFQALQNDNAGNNGQTGDGNGHNTAIGYNALQADTFGVGNTATGYQAMGQNTNGSFNTALGDNALNANTSGGKNTAIGTAALQYSQNDSNVVAIGFQALQNDNAGNNNQTSDGTSHNTAIGFTALQADSTGLGNTATGYEALKQNISGSFNTAYGNGALGSNTIGSNNVAIGNSALHNATDNGNIAIGSQAGNNLIAGQNNIYIGSPGHANENNSIHIGQIGTQTTTTIAGTAVGINNDAPTAALEVGGEFMVVDGLGGVQSYLGDDGVGNGVQLGSFKPGVTDVNFVNLADGANMHLICGSITITGGSDLAEPFQIAGEGKDVPQGAVVVIDEQNPGHLKLSDQPYDSRVAGVVSGANGIKPGIQMQQQGLLEGGRNVALTGRVYVRADATNGAIKPGDLLTTSSTPGRAMKVTDHAKAQGAILGKAMTGLREGKGTVLVLVTLQ